VCRAAGDDHQRPAPKPGLVAGEPGYRRQRTPRGCVGGRGRVAGAGLSDGSGGGQTPPGRLNRNTKPAAPAPTRTAPSATHAHGPVPSCPPLRGVGPVALAVAPRSTVLGNVGAVVGVALGTAAVAVVGTGVITPWLVIVVGVRLVVSPSTRGSPGGATTVVVLGAGAAGRPETALATSRRP